MNTKSNGSRIIIGLVVIAALALIGLLTAMFFSRGGFPGSNFAPAAGAKGTVTLPQGTALSLPAISRSTGASAARGRVRTSPVPEATIITRTQSSTPLATGDINSQLAVDVLSATYTPSGKPSAGCAQIDPATPGQRFDFVVNVMNRSGATLGAGDWGAQAYSGDKQLTLCYFGQTAQLPVLVNDGKTLIALVAFTDPNESVTSIVLGTTSGLEARTCFANGKIVPCK